MGGMNVGMRYVYTSNTSVVQKQIANVCGRQRGERCLRKYKPAINIINNLSFV